MDLEYSEELERFRAEVRSFLEGWPLAGEEAELPREQQEALFRNRAILHGYVYRDIPSEYGGGGRAPDVLEDHILREEFTRAGAPGNSFLQGPALLAPTLIEFGSEEQRRRFVPPTLREEIRWCQGYSEPGSGSDLASLQCSAVVEDGEWVINGQKIWTSNAQNSQWLFGLFRTEPDAPKHQGISYLLVPLDQPGIEIRPLKQLTGGVDFNEVFFENARTPLDHIVGERGQGWQISRATLRHERNLIANPNLMRDHFDALLELARSARRGARLAIEDPGVRQRLAEIECRVRTNETSNLRQLSAAARGEELECMRPMLMNKLYSTDTMQLLMKLAYELIGSDGLLAPNERDLQGYGRGEGATGWVEKWVFSLGPAIAGGATNIQLNIIAERGYGLPRDLRPAR